MELELWISLIILFAAGGLTPGPAVMLVIATSMRYGFRLALVSALGVCAANVLWITLAASGAGVLAKQFPVLFAGLKILGLFFILWLAWKTATQPVDTHFEEEVIEVFGPDARRPPKYGRFVSLFFRGVGLQIANPNALVFFGGLLPTFFNVSAPVLQQAIVMIMTVTLTEMFGLTVYGAAARVLAHKFSEPQFARYFYISAGIIMALSGIWAILSQIL